MKSSRLFAVSFIVAVLFSCPIFAQQTNPQPNKKEFEAWTDISFDTTSIGALKEEDVRGRKLAIAGFRYSYRVMTRQNFSIDYTLDVIPVAIAFSSEVSSDTPLPLRENVYGWGASPIGFSLHFGPARTVQPFFNIAGGFLHFEKPVPSPIGTLWNFTATAGGGVRFQIAKHAIDAGYMFHHISNGREQIQNPSLNTHVLYFGFVVLTR